MLRRVLLSVCPLVALLVGCGNSRTPVPSLLQPASPQGLREVDIPNAGIAFNIPRNWSLGAERVPLVATVSSGAAVVAVWNYPRHSSPPIGRGALARARVRLVAAARARDPSLQLIHARAARLDRLPAIELDAVEQIAGQTRRVRSTHVFTDSSELVLDEYAPPALFRAVDHSVFSPLKHSLRLFPAAGA